MTASTKKPTSKRQRGSNALEMALVMPILILLVFGIVEFGRGYNAKVTLTHAAREGVRACSLGQDHVAAAQNASSNLSGVSVSGCSCPTPGDPAQVTVSYSFSYDIPLFGSSSVNLSESATMRCGG